MRVKNSRYNRLQSEMSKLGLDAVVATTFENNYYLGNFQNIGQKYARDAIAFTVVAADSDLPQYILTAAEIPSALEDGILPEQLHTFGGFRFDYADGSDFSGSVRKTRDATFPDETAALQHVLNKVVGGKKFGLDMGNVSCGTMEHLREAAPGASFVPAQDLLAQLRAIKDSDEISNIERASEIAENAMLAVLKEVRPGMSEYETASLYQQKVLQAGAEATFGYFTFGHRAAFVDTKASKENLLKAGDIIRCDVGCSINGYQSDMSRTAVYGSASAEIKAAYNAILQGELDGIAAMRPGARTDEIFELCVSGTQKNGLPQYARHHCGHSIGLRPTEAPLINAASKAPLKEGMVFCVETPYYRAGWGGVQVEDTVLITKDGYRFLTKSDKNLIELT